MPSSLRIPIPVRLVSATVIFMALLACTPPAASQSAYVRVNQVGYEAGESPFRAYLMSLTPESGATFEVVNSRGATAYSGHLGVLAGTWSHSKTLAYHVFALDFNVPAGDLYTISVPGPETATSPPFRGGGAGQPLFRFTFEHFVLL
jgi:hypothetical protein